MLFTAKVMYRGMAATGEDTFPSKQHIQEEWLLQEQRGQDAAAGTEQSPGRKYPEQCLAQPEV